VLCWHPQDPIFKGNKVPNPEMGYPGGIFDPLGFSKGNLKELQTKEIKNGRIAMVAYMGFVLQVRTGVCCEACFVPRGALKLQVLCSQDH
jgi:hypothetical protein